MKWALSLLVRFRSHQLPERRFRHFGELSLGECDHMAPRDKAFPRCQPQ